MANLVRTNILSNMRMDLPDYENIEKFVTEDFNAVMKFLMSGSSKVISGFRIFQDSACLIDTPVSSPVYIKLANSSVLHTESTGTPFYYVGASSISAAQIDLVPSATNYIEMELTLTTGSPDTRALWDPSANNGQGAEFTQIVDTANNLTATFTVNNIGFSGGNKLPIAEIVMTGSVISSNIDRRNLFFRLGIGQPENDLYEYPWSQGRSEPNPDKNLDSNAYIGADKSISTFKEWMDAIMTEIKHLKGGTYWFSNGSSLIPGVNISDLFFDTVGSVLTGTGKFQHSAITPGLLTWTSNLFIKSIFGKLELQINSGSVTLTDEQVGYVQLVRNQDFQSSNTFAFVNGSVTVTAVNIISGIVSGDWIKASSDSLNKWTKVDTVVGSTITLLTAYPGSSISEKALRTQGTYTSIIAANPTAVPMNSDVWVLAKRSDNGGSTARLYLRGGGHGEIEQGEETTISDNQSDDILTFIGSTSEVDNAPNYLFLPNVLSPFTFSNGDSLVRAIYQTVANVNDIFLTLDNPSYDENVTGVAIVADTTITIPVNSRLTGSPQQFYTVGKGALEVFLNGQRLPIGASGWDEQGVAGSASSDIKIHQDLLTTDLVTYRIGTLGGPGSGGSGGAAPDDDFNTLAASVTPDPSDFILIYDVSVAAYKKQLRSVFLAGLTNDYAITTKTANYTVLISDNIILVDTSGGAVTITLPNAAAAPGHIFIVKKKSGGAANALIITAVAGNIENLASQSTVTDGDSFTITSDGVNYWIV